MTTALRTAVDIARTASFRDAVPLVDNVLRNHGGENVRALLLGLCEQLRGRKGIAGAREVIRFADPLAESGGESVSRVVMAAMGLPEPVLQFVVYDAYGRPIGRTDFGWPELGTLGEFDGLVKYRGLADERGERPDEVVVREKIREDELRAQGWEVVRWTRSELERPEVLAAKIRAAFARARARGFPPGKSRGGQPGRPSPRDDSSRGR